MNILVQPWNNSLKYNIQLNLWIALVSMLMNRMVSILELAECITNWMLSSLWFQCLSIKSPCLHLVFGPAFTTSLLFQWYLQSNENWLNLGMKCLDSAFNAQGSRPVIVFQQVGVVKIYVVAVEIHFVTKFVWKASLGPSYFAL
jgi:hypothetical protein